MNLLLLDIQCVVWFIKLHPCPLPAFNFTQEWTSLLKTKMEFHIVRKWADKEYLPIYDSQSRIWTGEILPSTEADSLQNFLQHLTWGTSHGITIKSTPSGRMPLTKKQINWGAFFCPFFFFLTHQERKVERGSIDHGCNFLPAKHHQRWNWRVHEYREHHLRRRQLHFPNLLLFFCALIQKEEKKGRAIGGDYFRLLLSSHIVGAHPRRQAQFSSLQHTRVWRLIGNASRSLSISSAFITTDPPKHDFAIFLEDQPPSWYAVIELSSLFSKK